VRFSIQSIKHLVPQDDLAGRNIHQFIEYESCPTLPGAAPLRCSGSAILLAAITRVLDVRTYDSVIEMMRGAVHHLMLVRVSLGDARTKEPKRAVVTTIVITTAKTSSWGTQCSARGI
jgi:hypothetical protein